MHDLSTSCAYFHFVQQVARYEGTDSPHVRVSFIIVACILMHDLPTSCAYFHFVQHVARYEATYPSHERVSISCNKLHATRRPIHLISVFLFRATSCTLQGDLPTSCVCFHFVQQVARYEATYPPCECFHSCNTLHEMWGMVF